MIPYAPSPGGESPPGSGPAREHHMAKATNGKAAKDGDVLAKAAKTAAAVPAPAVKATPPIRDIPQ